MKRHRLRAALVVSAIVAPMTLAACSTNSGSGSDSSLGNVTIRVWVAGQDTPQEARDYLKVTFEQEYPDATLVIEEQSRTGLLDRLENELNSTHSPDVVEIGSTQAPALTSMGLLAPLTDDQFAQLGGTDLLKEYVTIGDWEGRHYAVPYYATARVVFYSAQMYPSLAVPATLDDYVATAQALTTDKVSGLYWPGQNWYNALPFVWENGGFIAEQHDDGTWGSGFATDGGIAGLRQVQALMSAASHAGKEEQDKDLQGPFCAGSVAMVSTVPSFQSAVQSSADSGGCPDGIGGDLMAFPLPSKSGNGPAQVLGGGSNIGIAAKSAHPDQAFSVLSIMLSDKYQAMLGARGLAPAKFSLGATVPQGNPIARAAVEAAGASRLTPATPRWAEVESQNVMQNAMIRLGNGEDVVQVAQDLDRQIEEILNS